MRVLEEAKEDEGFTADVRAIALSEENKRLKQAKGDADNAKHGLERKVEESLKDKKHLKELHR